MNVAIPRNCAHLSAAESRELVCVNRRLQVPYSVCVDIKLTALETTAIAFDDDESTTTTTTNGVAIAVVVISAAIVATATVTTMMTIVDAPVLRSLTMAAAVVAVASVYSGRVLNVSTNLN